MFYLSHHVVENTRAKILLYLPYIIISDSLVFRFFISKYDKHLIWLSHLAGLCNLHEKYIWLKFLTGLIILYVNWQNVNT